MLGQDPEIMPETPMMADEEMTALTVESMQSNYEGMDADNKTAISQLMQDPIVGILDSLTGGSTFSQFAQSIGDTPAPTPDVPASPSTEGIMSPGQDMPPPSMPTLAEGGMTTTSRIHDMVKKGMSRQEILSAMK
jgi:hypothetical protein